jgi:hypothetical protein
MDGPARRKTLALVVVGAAILLGGRWFRPVVGLKESTSIHCRLTPQTSERRVDLTLQRDGKTVRTLSVPVEPGQDSVSPSLDLRPGSYSIVGQTQAEGRVLKDHTNFDVPGGAPVLMLAAPQGVIP